MSAHILSLSRKKIFLLSIFFSVFGFIGTAEDAGAQWYGMGWCDPVTGCTGTIRTAPGSTGSGCSGLNACPMSGLGCTPIGGVSSGDCCTSSGGYSSFVCEADGGGDSGDNDIGGGGCTTGVSPNLSYSCNSAGTQAALSWSGGTTSGNNYALRINDPTAPPPPPASTWTGACPAASPDFCGDVTGSSRSFITVPGRTYGVWIHSYDVCCGSFGCSVTPTAVPTSISVTCSPPPPPAPTLTFTADSYALPANGSTTLRWTSQNATSCTASRSPVGGTWTGPKGFTPNQLYTEPTGPLAGGPSGTVYAYTLSCANSAGVRTSITRNISVAAPPLPPPLDPTGLTATCLAPDRVRLSWNPVISATVYAFRADYATPSWNPCVSPDECRDLFTNSYEKTVTPGVTYDWWVHAGNASGWSPGIHGPNFRCDYPASTIRGRITNQATGAGIPGIVIPACAANPGATTDASGNYSFTVPYDARFCIRPNTPMGMTVSPFLSGLQPSQRVSIHTYEWQVAGWNAGVHPLCDNFDSVNRIPASCDEWKQWDIATGDTGYDFVYSSLPTPMATLSLDPNPVNIHPTAGSPTVRARWSSTNATSCVATSGTGFATGGATSSPGVIVPTPGSVGSYPYSIRCTGPGGSNDASASLNVVSVCNPTRTCTASDICEGESCDNGCGVITDGTKDCRQFWREVAP